MWPQHLLAIAALTVGVAAAHSQSLAPDSLPAIAAAQLAKSLEAARAIRVTSGATRDRRRRRNG